MRTIVTTPTCPFCGAASSIELTYYESVRLRYWQQGRSSIQDIFPKWSAEKREMFVSGTHPACWDAAFKEEEEEEEE